MGCRPSREGKPSGGKDAEEDNKGQQCTQPPSPPGIGVLGKKASAAMPGGHRLGKTRRSSIPDARTPNADLTPGRSASDPGRSASDPGTRPPRVLFQQTNELFQQTQEKRSDGDKKQQPDSGWQKVAPRTRDAGGLAKTVISSSHFPDGAGPRSEALMRSRSVDEVGPRRFPDMVMPGGPGVTGRAHSDPGPRPKQIKVKFGSVELHEFPRSKPHDGTPAPKSGGPGLGMALESTGSCTFKLSEFEKLRCYRRTPRERFFREGRVPNNERCRLLGIRPS